jgi:hypothetical protein
MKKGTKHTIAAIEKMRVNRKGKNLGRVAWNKGKILSPEQRLKCGKYWIGKKHTKDTKQKMSKSAMAENNSQWKGNKVGYCSLHEWIRNRKPQPKQCQHCGKLSKHLDLANISGQYCRDINDYRYLCRSCHQVYDCIMGFRTKVYGKII